MEEGRRNEMRTPLERALHYVECYDMHFPFSGANWVAEELREEIEMGDYDSHDGVKAETARQGQVSEQLGQLKGAIEVLDDIIGLVEDRLKPVLRVEDEVESKPDAQQLVPLADRINILAIRVQQQNERLGRILERLEL